VTAHRAENVDARERIEALFAALDAVADTFDLDLVYPCHPRTRARLASFGIAPGPRLLLRPPAGLLDFLVLERFARIVLTDSGGVQEECCILGSPCVTLRDSTERPETIEVGANVLAGLDRASVLEATREMLGRHGAWPNPFGDGHAGDRIVAAIAPLCGAG
jgi:UDP-N-acetylglucosamine 2-epimerase (non-hydrolysing)